MDFTTNNCGMYWSDGKIQSSVGKFHTKPVNALDAACQVHDYELSNNPTITEQIAADNKFYETTRHLGIRGKIYGLLVKYGNKVLRMGNANSTYNPFASGGGVNEVYGTITQSNLRGGQSVSVPTGTSFLDNNSEGELVDTGNDLSFHSLSKPPQVLDSSYNTYLSFGDILDATGRTLPSTIVERTAHDKLVANSVYTGPATYLDPAINDDMYVNSLGGLSYGRPLLHNKKKKKRKTNRVYISNDNYNGKN